MPALANTRTLVRRMMVGALLLNLFVYVLAGLALYQSRQQYQQQATLTTQNLAQTLAINVYGVIDKIGVGLYAAVNETEYQMAHGGVNGPALNAYLQRETAQIRDLEGMWVSDAKGDIYWGADVVPDKPVSITDRKYFVRQRDDPDAGLVISEPVMGRVTHAWSLLLSRRIQHADGSFAGIALGSLRMEDYFKAMFTSIDVGRNGLIALRDDRMNLIVRYPTIAAPQGLSNPNAISSQALEMLRAQPKAGTYVAVSALDNTQRVFGYQKVRDYPFYIFVALGTQDFLGNWYRDLSIALVMLACFTVVTVLYVRLNYKRVQEMDKTQELARHSALLELANTQLERGMTGTVNAISKMMNLRDPYTSGHEWRVGEIAAAIAAEMGLDEPTQRGLRVAGGVHDVGMVNVPAEILFKPGKLSELEYQVIQDHAEQGYDILHDIDFPWPVAEAARQHHERLDGSGYPQGLKKDQILLEARILAVADVVESMASHRPYRMALGIDQALEEIERGSGTLYDADVAAACLRLFREKAFRIPQWSASNRTANLPA